MKTVILIVFFGLANMALTYSCFEVQEGHFNHVQQAVYPP